MKKIFSLLTLSAGALLAMTALNSCSKEEVKPYNHPFFHIHVENRDSVTVRYNRKDQVEYKAYLSAELQYETIDLSYSVKIGDGLLEGRDFELNTVGDTLRFIPGVMARGVKITWLENPVDPAKDNTIKISLTGNSKNFTLGLPGPDQRQRQLVITKTN